MTLAPEDIKLVSDFVEPYDHHFAARLSAAPHTWERSSKTTRTRQDDLLLLQRVGLDTPHFSCLSYMEGMVVAYVDPHAHRGEGKLRGFARDLLVEGVSPYTTCTKWHGCPGVSRRILAAGHSFYGMDYRSDGWRSNVGHVEITLVEFDDWPGYYYQAMRKISYLQEALRAPLVAVDFVQSDRDTWLAIDLNTAPGIKGTPADEERRVLKRDFAESIASRYGELLALKPCDRCKNTNHILDPCTEKWGCDEDNCAGGHPWVPCPECLPSE